MHTPGPWINRGTHIAAAPPELDGDTCTVVAAPLTHHATKQADLSLISAAPELLESLKVMLGLWEIATIGGSLAVAKYCEAKGNKADRARAAIAKAEGR